MNLFINSPTYYKNIYGIDDAIYRFCFKISCEIDITKYTNMIDSIAITPIIAPLDVLNKEKLKEIKYVSLNYRFSDISLYVDYSKYVNGNIEDRKKLILENIMKSVKMVKKKLRDNFDYDLFEIDIKGILLESDDLLLIESLK